MKPTLGRFKKEPKQVQGAENEPSDLGAAVLAVRGLFLHLLVGCGKGRQEALGKVQNEAHIRKVQKGTQTSTKKSLALSRI